MNKRSFAALAVVLGASFSPICHAQDAAAERPAFNPHGIPFPAGVYKCELNRSVQIRSVASDQQTAVLRWDKKDYTLKAVQALSGALRYEDPGSGLVWLVIVGKSMLLDTKQGKQLANECRAST